MTRMTSHSFIRLPGVSIKRLLVGSLGLAVGLSLGASMSFAQRMADPSQEKAGQEAEEFRQLIFDETNHLWVVEQGGDIDRIAKEGEGADPTLSSPDELPQVSAPPPGMQQPAEDED